MELRFRLTQITPAIAPTLITGRRPVQVTSIFVRKPESMSNAIFTHVNKLVSEYSHGNSKYDLSWQGLLLVDTSQSIDSQTGTSKMNALAWKPDGLIDPLEEVDWTQKHKFYLSAWCTLEEKSDSKESASAIRDYEGTVFWIMTIHPIPFYEDEFVKIDN